MKRDHPESTPAATNEPLQQEGSSSSKCTKTCSMYNWDQQDGSMDELLALLGYNVKSSAMADVAHKLEQLEMAMGTVQDDGISLIASDTVHYNPSDIDGWIQNILSELSPIPSNNTVPIPAAGPGQYPSSSSSSSSSSAAPAPAPPPPFVFQEDNSEYDLRVIPGIALYNPSDSTPTDTNDGTRTKHNAHHHHHQISSCTTSIPEHPPPPPPPPRPLVLAGSQDTGVRLVHALKACAEAVQNHNRKLADALLKQIGLLAVSQAGPMRKVATYFAEALARRVYNIHPQHSSIDSDVLLMHFYDACPYLKFAHFTANQAILEAVSGANRVHVIDFSTNQGMQWPPLMQYLAALRVGCPPSVFRLTAIGPPLPEGTDALQEVGWKLAQFASTVGLEFHYQGIVWESLADLDAAMLDIKPEEAVAVNSVFELHRLLARPGDMEMVLSTVRAVNPRVVTVAEQEVNHNGPVFLDRFNEALYYYCTMFDSLEGGSEAAAARSSEDVVMSEVYLGRQICNVVACEGAERVERHETLRQWRARMESSGFEPVHLGSNAFKQASMLLAVFSGCDGYRVEENGGCLLLGWHTRPLIATSAWRPRGSTIPSTTTTG